MFPPVPAVGGEVAAAPTVFWSLCMYTRVPMAGAAIALVTGAVAVAVTVAVAAAVLLWLLLQVLLLLWLLL